MLAHPIEEGDWADLSPPDIVAEWKWDGVRVQIAAGGGEVRIFSRSGDDISASFPEIVAAFQSYDAVLDGELLVVRDGVVAPFNDLQQRLNRKTVTAKMLRDYPAFVRLYDILIDDSEDVRPLPFAERRERLEGWHTRLHPRLTDVSAIVTFEDFGALDAWEQRARGRHRRADAEAQVEPVPVRAPQGPLVEMEARGSHRRLRADVAQRGSGKRSSYYSDYTFGVWRETEDDDGKPLRELVPVGIIGRALAGAALGVHQHAVDGERRALPFPPVALGRPEI